MRNEKGAEKNIYYGDYDYSQVFIVYNGMLTTCMGVSTIGAGGAVSPQGEKMSALYLGSAAKSFRMRG